MFVKRLLQLLLQTVGLITGCSGRLRRQGVTQRGLARVSPKPPQFLGNNSGLSALLIAWVMRSGKSLEEVMNGW